MSLNRLWSIFWFWSWKESLDQDCGDSRWRGEALHLQI